MEFRVISTGLEGPWDFYPLLRYLRRMGFRVLNGHWSKGTAEALVIWQERTSDTSHPNPMHSRCGLEDCDCGYVIEKQTAALRQAIAIVEQAEGPRMGRFWLPNFLADANYAIHLAEEHK